ncbi:monosaccharide ABC transporter substrate-binding protein, CUT2 family (TC 3.A.1.2.-) [Saccharopolyspora kobensis]|uniref:Monosaccharide ABC transporter substrate-binding protein, CUT2 family n=1 Tax=Saccharopolyspora kobensis TaxID=146035 RepID=A0A1H6A6R5_9PSEU|nr:ABC transporter substrate-binding protein [Saccharopolyspora kobensis]SEG44418.1 monosaccharide ABC transporter substrate-binding protein, CUT2 family (TC 3.A.1.2.-) [Saccharopolyspora kobensis]SFE51574.1 monosaccharide ABC transporter substrate-binding protein, CUT2 family [Saccharopolyspora kobensis]
MARIRFVSSGVAAAIAVVAVGAGLVGGKAAFGPTAEGTGSGTSGVAGTRIDVITKATDSEFWQSMLAGSERAGADLGVELGLFGPTSETDIDQQVSLVENSIARGAKAIVLASNSSTALNGAVDRARQQGIKVITVDNSITTASEGFIGTDNVKAGQQAGQRMCELLTAQGRAAGKILHESSTSGQQVLADRLTGFRAGLAEKCPQAAVVQTAVNDNDLNKAVGQVNDAITGIPDLAGIFADNNTSGTGAARAVAERGVADRLAVVAFDSDPAEVEGVRNGSIDAILVQNPFFFGYQGVVEAAMSVAGSTPPVDLDPGAVVIDKSEVDKPEHAQLLDPPKTKG